MNRPRAVRLDGEEMARLMAPVLAGGASVRFVALGGSMSPWIRDGDVVTIVPLTSGDAARLAPGDVVAFRRQPGLNLVVHRVLARAEGGWIVRGDRCVALDGLVADGDVLGRVSGVARGGLRLPVPRGVPGLLLVRAGRLALRIRDRLRGARGAVAPRPEA
jgi:hypothetical protein